MLTFVCNAMPRRCGLAALALMLVDAAARDRSAGAQATTSASTMCPPSTVIPIAPPPTALPSEDSSAAITRFSFIAYGDTRGPFDGRFLQPDHEKVVESIVTAIKARANGPDAVRFVLQTGDAVVDGRVAVQWNVSYNPLINRITAGAGIPYYLAVGNHDVTSAPIVSSPDRLMGLCNYFAANARLIPPEGSAHRLKDYPSYGIGYGNTFFLAFDTAIADDTTQYSWVKAELERLDRRRYPNVVVFVHQPPISSGPHGGPRIEPASATLRTFYMPLFRQHHVRLVISGHDHLFEHWVERYRDTSGAHRLDQIVTGGGGAPAYAYTGEPDLGDYLDEGSVEQLKVEHLVRPSPDARLNPLHFIVISINGAEMRVEVVGVGRGRGFAPYDGRATAVLADPAHGGVAPTQGSTRRAGENVSSAPRRRAPR
jgi:3',5'-cyclic AMP phosphodiesterase CpdA